MGGESVDTEQGDDGEIHDFWTLSAEQIEAIADAFVVEEDQ